MKLHSLSRNNSTDTFSSRDNCDDNVFLGIIVLILYLSRDNFALSSSRDSFSATVFM